MIKKYRIWLFATIGIFIFCSVVLPTKVKATTNLDSIIKDGMVWAFLGDSYLTQERYSVYMESYFHLRYPNFHLHFRSEGRSGGSMPALFNNDDPNLGFSYKDRYARYVYPWHPDVVATMFSTNSLPTQLQFDTDLRTLVGDYIIGQTTSTPVILTAWPNNTYNTTTQNYYNALYAASSSAFATENGYLFADIYNYLNPIFIANRASNTIVINGGLNSSDIEHLNGAGTLAAAYGLLSQIGAIGDVSSATINATNGTVSTSSNATINVSTFSASRVDFTRLDTRLPMAFDDDARPIVQIIPEVYDLNKYMLKVDNLISDRAYDVFIDGELSATVNSNILGSSNGWNMTSMTKGPIHRQLLNVLDQIRLKEGVSTTTLDNTSYSCIQSPGWTGVCAYKGVADAYYVAGARGEELFGALSGNGYHGLDYGNIISSLNTLDTSIHTAAQPMERTFSVRLVSPGSESPLTINATALGRGTVNSSSGTSSVNYNSNTTYTITTNNGYNIGQVKVDGVSATLSNPVYTSDGSISRLTSGTYTFNNVTTDHTIWAGFPHNYYLITTSYGSNGYTSSSYSAEHGTNRTFNIYPNADYQVADVLVDGVSVGAVTSYTFGNVITEHTLSATFAPAGPDTTPPNITSVASSTTSITATITWSTNELATSTINYGLTTGYGTASSSATINTSHSFTLTNLATSTTYHFQISSWDVSGNLSTSSDLTFRTTVPDITPPTVSVTAPTNGSTVLGTITVSASSSDNIAVAGVQFKLDGVSLGAEDTTSPYSITWNASALSGIHTLTAIARDISGNIATSSSISVTVSNPVDISPPNITSVASSTTDTSATITWTTNELSTSSVNYGLTTGYGTASSSATAKTSHSFTVSNLATSTTYHFQASSWDTNANFAVSSDYTFTTTATTTSTTTTTTVVVPPPTTTTRNVGGGGGGGGGSTILLPVLTTNSTFPRIIPLNSTGPDVKTLQIWLNSKGYTIATTGAGSKGKETTFFGNATSQALKKLQTSANLPITGILDEATRKYINSQTTNTTSTTNSTLSPDKLAILASLQKQLAQLLILLQEAMIREGKTVSISIPIPASSLLFSRNLWVNMQDPDVKRLQVWLNSHNFLIAESGPGSIGNESDRFGNATIAALKKFQASVGVPQTGGLDEATRAKTF